MTTGRKKHSTHSRVLLGIFGPIAALCAVLVFSQYIHYRTDKKRSEYEFYRQQDIVTSMAASRVQSYTHDIVKGLESLAVQVGPSVDRSSQFEKISATYDELDGEVDGIAYFDKDGNKVNSVSQKIASAFPSTARYEDFFTVPKQTTLPYISPLVKVQGEADSIFISCPVRSAGTGEFGGVVIARIASASFMRLCDDLNGLSSQVRFTYYDQQFQQICVEPHLVSTTPLRKDLMGDTVATDITRGANGYGARVRVEYLPVMLEGYRWYLYSEMRLDGLDRIVAEDNKAIFLAALLYMLCMVGGGVYLSKVYFSKARAEKEAGKQAALAAGAGALAAEKDMLRAVMDTLPAGIMLLDRGSGILDVNKKMKEILGLAGDATLAQVKSSAEGNDLLVPAEEVQEKVLGDKTYTVIAVAVRDEAAGSIREVRVLLDVTLQKSLEQKKADLVSMITHDVKSPLTVIVGITGWLLGEGQAGALPDEMKSGIETMRGAAKRVISLMDNFLFLSSVEGMRKLVKTPVSLNAFLGRAILEFSLEARLRNIKLDYNFPEHSQVVRMDETQMMRAVENLLSNALKYTPDGGSVSVVARSYRDYVTISVTDDGPGINKDDLSRIFERRFRGKTVRKIPKGSGLGLTIVKAVVDAHGGAVDVASDEGKGATFTLRLPISGVA